MGFHAYSSPYDWSRIAGFKATAKTVPGGMIDLSVGSPVDPVPSSVQQALVAGADAPNAHGYPVTAGTADLKAAIDTWFRELRGVDLKSINAAAVPTVGSKEAVALMASLLHLGEGDVVVQPAVSYPTYEIGTQLAGATVVMVLLLGLTRIVFAMSRDGLLPRGLSKTGKHGTPAALQIVVGAVVALVAAFFDIGVLSDMVNIGTLSAFTLVAISIPIMRKKRPDLPRAFKMPGSPWIPILIAVANFWLMLNLSVLTWIRFVVWLVVGFAIYFGYGYWHARLGKGDLTETLSAETDKAVNG